ncbi:MAG: hypothetical protein JHC93_02820 [Parachlamydiales bacterium]|nr:hypothetical protein [Parachlamydiales bacterium]
MSLGRTKEESFMIKLAELTHYLDDGPTPIEFVRIGQAVGISEKSAKNAVNMLAQTNFVKKIGTNAVTLTPQGERLVAFLLKQED